MVVRLARVVPVQRVEPRVGLIAEGFVPHRTEVKVEAVHQKVNFDPGPPGLWTHRRGGARDEGGVVDHAARLVLRGVGGQSEKCHSKISLLCEFKQIKTALYTFLHDLFSMFNQN